MSSLARRRLARGVLLSRQLSQNRNIPLRIKQPRSFWHAGILGLSIDFLANDNALFPGNARRLPRRVRDLAFSLNLDIGSLSVMEYRVCVVISILCSSCV